MINKKTGVIKIGDNLEISPTYKFDDYKKTPYYRDEDGIKEIILSKEQIIEGRHYFVSLIFRNQLIYSVSLINSDKIFSEKEEPKRKEVHDEILQRCGITQNHEYKWGKILSEYDSRSNMSSISIYYNSIMKP